MAIIKIYNDIVDEESKVILQNWCGTDGICYKDITEFLKSISEDDKEIDIRLHCRGGSCVEGWAIYDALRRSGKEITATIEGECSSMATIILLAAPLERRFAYKNAHICIHNPAVEYIDTDWYNRLTADNLDKTAEQIQNQAKSLRMEQKKILNLYVERTSGKEEDLQALMNKDIYIDTEKAIQLGFISSTLAPTTATRKKSKLINSNFTKMSRKERKIQVKQGVISRLLAKAGLARLEDLKMIDQVITSVDGTELTVEREDGDPQVGDVAYPDGEYVLEDGTTIVVEGEIITEIKPAEDDTTAKTEEEYEQEIADLEQLITEKDARIAELEKELEGKEGEVTSSTEKQILAKVQKAGGLDWLNQILGMKSTFNAGNRKFIDHNPGGSQNHPGGRGETKTQKAIREQKERAAARRSK